MGNVRDGDCALVLTHQCQTIPSPGMLECPCDLILYRLCCVMDTVKDPGVN